MKAYFQNFFSIISTLTLCFCLIQCTGAGTSGNPGGGPNSEARFEEAITALGPVGSVDSNENRSAPAGQPTDDFTTRELPQFIRIFVHPPKSTAQNNDKISENKIARVKQSSGTENHYARETDQAVIKGRRAPAALNQIQWDSQSNAEVAWEHGPFFEQSAYVWITRVSLKQYIGFFHTPKPTNEEGIRDINLLVLGANKPDCNKTFSFHACWPAERGSWVAEPLIEVCPQGDENNPFIVRLPLVRMSDLPCPPGDPKDQKMMP